MTLEIIEQRLSAKVEQIKAEREAMTGEVRASGMSDKSKKTILSLLNKRATEKMNKFYDVLEAIGEEKFELILEQEQAEKAAEVTA